VKKNYSCFIVLLILPLPGGYLRAASQEELAKRLEVSRLQVPEKPFDQLSHQKLTPIGNRAMAMIPEKEWHHAESEHLIIHYQHWAVRERLAREAEFYYWKIQNDLKLTNDLVKHKSHIFVFQEYSNWKKFQAQTDILNIGGVTIRHEFFCYYPKEKTKESSGVVAHEMTHLVFNRFFVGDPPLWLNEGFAEYQAHNAYLVFYNQRYPVVAHADPSAVQKLDLLEITGWTAYPEDPSTKAAFYMKSQLAAEVLVEKGGIERFVQFVQSMIENHDFETAFNRHYIEIFKDYAAFLKELDRKEKKL